MSFIFQDERTQEQWWISLAVKLAAHYCATSNNMNIPAGLGQTLVNEDVLRIFSCRQQIWSKWVAQFIRLCSASNLAETQRISAPLPD